MATLTDIDGQIKMDSANSILEYISQAFLAALAFCNSYSGAIQTTLILVLVITTWRYLKLTNSLLVETRRIRELETEPNITLYTNYLKNPDGSLKEATLHIRNIGKGYARNIVLSFPKEVKKIILHDYNKIHPQQKFVKLINTPGIPQIAPDDMIKIPVRELIKMIRQKVPEEKRILPVSVKYENVNGKSLSNLHYVELYPKDL